MPLSILMIIVIPTAIAIFILLGCLGAFQKIGDIIVKIKNKMMGD